MDQGMMDD